MIASNTHGTGEQPSPVQSSLPDVGKFPHRRGLGDGDVVEHTESGDDDGAGDEDRHVHLRRDGSQQKIVLTAHTGEM